MNFTNLSTVASRQNFFGKAVVGSCMREVKQRTVLGVLSENEQQSKVSTKVKSSTESSSTVIFPQACSSSYQFDETLNNTNVFFLPSPTNQRILYENSVALQDDFHLLLDQSSGFCMENPMQDLLECEILSVQEAHAVEEYAEEINQHLRQSELKLRPKPCYMTKQPDITNWMRIVLVDWLVEVGEEYKLNSETVFLAVNYLDRFLSSMFVLRGKLQLVGTAAIFLAAKYEEVYPPEVDEFVYITDDTYSKKQLLRMEHLLLKVLGFNLTVPTTHQFLMLYIAYKPISAKTVNLAQFLAELSLVEVDPFLHHLPSKIAAASYCLANYTINQRSWPDPLYALTGYTLAEIAPCLKDLHRLHRSAASRPQQALGEKYKTIRNNAVSLIAPLESLPFF